MYHFYDVVINDTTGVPLSGVIIRLYSNNVIVPLFADAAGTVPIQSVSGVANGAVTDGAGNFDFYVADGTYDMRYFIGDAVLKILPAIQMVVAASTADVAGKANATAIGVAGTASNLGLFTTPLVDDNTTAKAALESVGANLADATKGAALVGFKQAGAGAISRTAADKLGEQKSVKDYGAIGDGANHTVAEWLPPSANARYANLAALQADYPFVTATTDYIDWAATKAAEVYVTSVGGGTVFIPFGTYTLNKEITVTGANTRFQGMGRGGTIIKPATNANCFNFTASGGGGWGVSDLSIIYSANGTAGAGILSPNLQNGSITEVYFERCYDSITLGNSQATTVSGCQFWYFVRHGINTQANCNDIFLSHLFFNGAAYGTATPGASSIALRFFGKAHAIMASNIEIVQCMRPMLADGGSGILTFAFSTFENVFFDSSTNPVLVNNALTVKFMGCWISQRATGMILQDCKKVKFIGTDAVNCDMHGIELRGTTQWVSFNGCTIDSNGQAGSGGTTYDGVVVQNGVNNIKFVDCEIGNFGDFAVKQASGISFAGNNSGCFIDLCTFNGNTFAPIFRGANVSIGFGMNAGLVTKVKGRATVSNGSGSTIVTHGLFAIPAKVLVTALNDPQGRVWCELGSRNATTFTINQSNAAVGYDVNYDYEAEI